MSVIEINKLTKLYSGKRFSNGKITALKDVSFSVGNGEIFGLLGPNGAGKTTLIKILLGITFPTEGSATLFDRNIHLSSSRKNIGYLPENHMFPNFFTGEQVLNYFGSLSGLSRSYLKSNINVFLKKVGMNEWGKTKIRKYSKGMMQRIGLAQAILSNPDLIFLDEPTDGVDPIGRKEIRDVLINLKNEGKTIFLNSHLLSEVEIICDRVAILDKGQLKKVGTVEDITTNANKYIFTTSDLNDEIINSLLSKFKIILSGKNEFSITVKDVSEVNIMIDFLRSNSILIHSINHEKHTLESMFINIIEHNNPEDK